MHSKQLDCDTEKMPFPLTENQIRQKKKWLNWTIFLQIWNIINVCAMPFIVTTGSTLDKSKFPAIFFGALIGALVQFIVLYINAFKRNGTRLLTLFLIFSPMFMGKKIIQRISQNGLTDSWMWIGLILDIAIFIIWYRYTVLIRKLNRQIHTGSVINI